MWGPVDLFEGAHERIRTADLILTKDVLYQLSYMGEVIEMIQETGKSGRRGSNSRHSAWKADALPTELLPRGVGHEWMGKDSNLRSSDAADLQSAPFGRLGHPSGRYVVRGCCDEESLARESWRWDLNPQPPDYKSGALPLSYASLGERFIPPN